MKKALGYILSIAGLIVLGYSLIKYFEDTESFRFLGSDVVISQGNLTPVIISAVVTIIGLILLWAGRKKK